MQAEGNKEEDYLGETGWGSGSGADVTSSRMDSAQPAGRSVEDGKDVLSFADSEVGSEPCTLKSFSDP